MTVDATVAKSIADFVDRDFAREIAAAPVVIRLGGSEARTARDQSCQTGCRKPTRANP